MPFGAYEKILFVILSATILAPVKGVFLIILSSLPWLDSPSINYPEVKAPTPSI